MEDHKTSDKWVRAPSRTKGSTARPPRSVKQYPKGSVQAGKAPLWCTGLLPAPKQENWGGRESGRAPLSPWPVHSVISRSLPASIGSVRIRGSTRCCFRAAPPRTWWAVPAVSPADRPAPNEATPSFRPQRRGARGATSGNACSRLCLSEARLLCSGNYPVRKAAPFVSKTTSLPQVRAPL